MPRYFFDLTNGKYEPDVVGTELAGLEEARLESVILSGNLLKENPALFWNAETWLIEVKDDVGLILFTLNFMATEAPIIRGRGLPSLQVVSGRTPQR